MRIMHCCLSCFYIDGYSYQENLLPKFHKQIGYEVEIVASTETFIDNNNLGYINPCRYKNEDGIDVIRLPYAKLPKTLARKIRWYPGFRSELEKFAPDIIFFHGTCAEALLTASKYVRQHGIELYVDSHEDSTNSARTFVSKNILHGLLYRRFIQRAIPYVQKFWGTVPARCDFMHSMYGIPEEKIDLLIMGADDELVARCTSVESKATERIRSVSQRYIASFWRQN